MEAKDSRKISADLINKNARRNISCKAYDSDDILNVYRKNNKDSTIWNMYHEPAFKYWGIQRYYILWKESGIPDRKYCLVRAHPKRAAARYTFILDLHFVRRTIY